MQRSIKNDGEPEGPRPLLPIVMFILRRVLSYHPPFKPPFVIKEPGASPRALVFSYERTAGRYALMGWAPISARAL